MAKNRKLWRSRDKLAERKANGKISDLLSCKICAVSVSQCPCNDFFNMTVQQC